MPFIDVFSVGERGKNKTGTVPYLTELVSPGFCLLPIEGTPGHRSSERASLVAQSSEGPKGVHESMWQARTLKGMPAILGWQGSVWAGVAGEWGCQQGEGGARLGAAVSLLSHVLGVESAFSQLVSL